MMQKLSELAAQLRQADEAALAQQAEQLRQADQPQPKIPNGRPGRRKKLEVPLDEQPLGGCQQMKAKRCPRCGLKTKFRRPDGTCFRCTWEE